MSATRRSIFIEDCETRSSPLGSITRVMVYRLNLEPMTWREIYDALQAHYPGREWLMYGPRPEHLLDGANKYFVYLLEDGAGSCFDMVTQSQMIAAHTEGTTVQTDNVTDLVYLAREIHQTAIEHGWWDCETCEGQGHIAIEPQSYTMTVAGARADARMQCPVCNGSGEHRNVGELLALVHSEVSEGLEARRHPELDEHCDKCDGHGQVEAPVTYEEVNGMLGRIEGVESCAKCSGTGDALAGSRFAEELADVVIRVLDICAAYDIDLGAVILSKHQYNKTRPHKHGKAF